MTSGIGYKSTPYRVVDDILKEDNTMKKIKGISVLFALVTAMGLISGCSDKEIPSGNNSASIIYDPMNTPISSTGTGEGKEPVSFAYSFSFGEDYFKIKNNELVLSPVLAGGNRGSVNVGLRVFVDGMPQYYKGDSSPDSTDMMRFDTIANTKKAYELTVDTVIDPNLTQHTIAAAGLVYPDYYPKGNTSFGNYHKMLSSVTSDLPTETAAFSSADNINILSLENFVMSQEQKEGFRINDTDGVMDIELNQNGVRVNTYEIKDNSLTLSFNAFSTTATVIPYRVSFYKNHKQIKFNDGYDYIDFSLEGGKMSQADIKISDVKSGDFIYCIAAPLINREMLLKTHSTIALDDGGGLPPESGSGIDQGNTSEKTSSAGLEPKPQNISDSRPYSETPTNGGSESDPNNTSISKDSFQDTMPSFSIGSTLYYTVYDGKMNIYSTQNGIDVIDKITFDYEDGRFFVHGNYISCYTVVGNDFFARLYDKELNLVRSVKLNNVLPQRLWQVNGTNCIDFDENHIVFAYWDSGKQPHFELRSCDWDLQNVKTIFSLPKDENNPTESIAAVRLCDDYAAFWINGYSNGKGTQSYGISDFSGNFKIKRKDGVYLPQTSGNIALWSDQHVDIGELPSGSIVVAQNGELSSFRTEDRSESQFAFLCGSSILTLNGSGNTLRIYNINGSKTAEIAIEDGYSGAEAIMIGNTVFVNAYGKSTTTLVYEVN